MGGRSMREADGDGLGPKRTGLQFVDGGLSLSVKGSLSISLRSMRQISASGERDPWVGPWDIPDTP